MSDLEKLQADWEKAEQRAVGLSNEYDSARAKVRERYADRLHEANDKAAEAQKRLADARAVDGLRDRPDGESLARALGLSLD